MIYLVILLFYILIVPVISLIILYKIMKKIDNIMKKDDNKKNKSVMSKRTHTNIGKNDYSKVFNVRKNAYEDYKTNKGLYEPVTPHKGVKLGKEV